MISIDLHTHSTASDGTLSPAELVQRAATAGVSHLALTDHDTTAGLNEARAQAGKVGIQLIPGCEISVTWKQRTVHIVGLNVDPENSELQSGLAKLREFRDWRAREIGRKLGEHGIEEAFEGACHHARGSLISRTHFAHFLVEKGHAKSVRDVFKHFLINNRPGYVRGEWADLQEVVGWIKNAGGQAVIAHPARYNLTRTKLLELIRDFRQAGGDGLEVVSGSHNRDECQHMAQHARQQELLASAGSDFHGPENPWIELGKLPELPAGCSPIWHNWQLD
jgi:predicted metal-dependent phosphoesterase TrpH